MTWLVFRRLLDSVFIADRKGADKKQHQVSNEKKKMKKKTRKKSFPNEIMAHLASLLRIMSPGRAREQGQL